MKLICGIIVFLLSLPAHGAGYKADWTPTVFYEIVELCRVQEIKGAIREYSLRGSKDNADVEKLTTEMIELLPTFDYVAAAHCYCSVNDASKVNTYSEVRADLDKLVRYLKSEKCISEMKQTLSRESIAKYRLK